MLLASGKRQAASGKSSQEAVRSRPSPLTPRPLRRGLSLIEVLLAMTIFFMAIVAISRLVDMGTDRELEARLHTTAARLAQNKLAEFEMGVESLDSTSGDFGDADSGWTWTMTSEQPGTNLYLVSVTVSREFKGQSFSLTLSQMMLDPSVKGAASAAERPDSSGGSQ